MSQEFIEAVRNGELERVEQMLDGDPSLASSETDEGVSAVLTGLYHQHPEVAEAIARRRDDLDHFEAAAMGRVSRLRDLIEEHPQRISEHSRDGFTPLHLAAFFGRSETVELLLEKGADPNAQSENPMKLRPLHSAVAHRDPEIKKKIAARLLQADADPDAKQHGGFTALHSAAAHGEKDLAELLLRHGASLDVQSDDNRTALNFAKEQNQSEMAAWLESR